MLSNQLSNKTVAMDIPMERVGTPVLLSLPVEFMPDLNAGKAGLRDFYVNHPSAREKFAATLTPAQANLWKNHQNSSEVTRDHLDLMEKYCINHPGHHYLTPFWSEPSISRDAVIGAGFGVVGGLITALILSEPGEGFVIIGGLVLGIVSGALLGGAYAATKIASTRYTDYQSSMKIFESNIIADRELIQSYERFIADFPKDLEQNPEIYNDYLGDCLKRIDTKIGDIHARREELKRELINLENQKQETSTREFSDPTLREALLMGHDEDMKRLQTSLELLQKWEESLNGLHQNYEDRGAIYVVKLSTYRKKLSDFEYAKGVGKKSEEINAAIKSLEFQIYADLTELAAMIRTTSEFELRQLTAMEMKLMGKLE